MLATGIIWVYSTILFLISYIIKRNDIADIAWGPGIAIVALVGYFTQINSSPLVLVLTCAVCIWALRLAIRIGIRNMRKTEDPRYNTWRQSWGKWFYVRSYGQIYLLQGLLILIMGYPLLHFSLWHEPISLLIFMIGLCVWFAGFFCEIIADYQLDQFTSNPASRGKIMQTGLWHYSRHPNYFGEVLLWWGVWIAISSAPYSIYALISPILITFLILKVSGIPMTEKYFKNNPEFQKYKSRTSAFFPLPPKN